MKKIAPLILVPLMLLPVLLLAQQRQINGKITDESGVPLAGVSVAVKGNSATTTTATDGTFVITAPNGNVELVVTHVGYTEKTVMVSGDDITVTLQQSSRQLDEVVVVGYGTQKRRNVTGAVSSFDARKLEERPLVRVDQALVGQMAGVQVRQTSGALGRGFSVQVRGTGSITAGNEPLYVIDGFPLATAAPNSSGGFPTGNPLDNINPNDIESIQVLKDASAAAIYGSRAANGVVLITTKKGQSGKARIGINTYIGYQERNRKLDMLNAEEWIVRAQEIIDATWVASSPAGGPARTASQTNEQRRVILGLPAGQVNKDLMGDDRWFQPGHPGLRYIDWQDEAFRKGLTTNIQLTASGGNDIVRYYISGNYAKQEGMVIHTDYTSYSARANVEVNANKRLKLGLNIAPTYSVNNDPGVEGKDNILHQLVSYSPVQEDTMGLYPNVGNNGQYRWSTSANGSIGKLEQMVGQTSRFRTITSIYADYQIINGLNFKTTVNLDNTDNNSKSYVPYTVVSGVLTRQALPPAGGNALSSGTYNSFRKQTFVNENTLSYNKVFADAHDFSLLLGQSYNQDKIDRININSSGGFRNSIQTLNQANAIVFPTTGNTMEARNVLISYFGRIQYSFNNKYLLSASMRRDGSSRFGKNTKWGWFPSASVGWRLSEENFMKNIDFISDLKIRGSWGKSGNYNIGDYSTVPLLGTYNYTLNGVSVIGQAPNSITNPDLSWEKSETYDVGLDVGLFNNRIFASFDYYTKLNTGLLLNVPIPSVTGFGTLLSNAGSARNKGWEIELTTHNLTGKLEWTTSINFSHNSNKVVSLAQGQNQILIPSSFDISHSILRVGLPMYSIYVVRQIGILTQDDINKGVALNGPEKEGDPKYEDQITEDTNGDGIPDAPDGVIDADDRVVVGHPNPDYIWGITNTVRYKGFDLTVMIQGQNGGHIYSLLGRALSRTGQGKEDNPLGTYRKRWFSPSDPGDGLVSKAYSTFGRIKNTDWLYSSDYFRVRNITLGYNLGNLFNARYVQSARVYITLENFFGHDQYKGGFNPEATNTDLSGSTTFPEPGDYGGLPLPRSLIFGLNFSF